MPTVSVIVPVYNAEKYLRRCVDSILNQTFTDFELILVDDGSKDSSRAICDEYAQRDSRVVVIHKENGGVSSARNAGLDCAKGEYIMFCDSDDHVAIQWVDNLYDAVCQGASDIALCGFAKIVNGEIKSSKFLHGVGCKTALVSRAQLWEIFSAALLHAVWNKIFKREIIAKNGLRFDENLSRAEDVLFVISYMQSCSGDIGIANTVTYFYVIENLNSLTHGYVENCWSIEKRYINEGKKLLNSCGVEINEIERDLNTYLLNSILVSINNCFSPMNTQPRFLIYKAGRNILRSAEAKEILANCEFPGVHFAYRFALKTRCFFFVWLFHLAVQLKHKFIK